MKKIGALLLYLAIEVAHCAEQNMVRRLRFSLRDPTSGEVSARCEADIISEEVDPIGFLNIAIRRYVLVNRVDIEVFDVGSLGAMIGCLNLVNRGVAIPVRIRLINFVFMHSNINEININECGLRFDNSIRFTEGEIGFHGVNQKIVVRNGVLCFGASGVVEVVYEYQGKRHRCEVVRINSI